MNIKAFIPSGISAIRLAALPLFLYLFSTSSTVQCIVVFGLTIISDLLDGYVARKLNVASKSGAYFDAVTDFVLIMGIFVAFTVSGYYPAWMLLLIALSFGQFIATSLYGKRLYDPLGKYIGSALYIAISLTLLSPTQLVFTVVEVAFPLWAVASFVTRTASYTVNYRRNLLLHKATLNSQEHTRHN